MKRIFLALLMTLPLPVTAEIYKVAVPDERCGGMCLYWWPVLPEVDGWQQDLPNSYHYSANAQAPLGESFSNAEAVIYAKALFKPRMPETKSLSQLITDDQNEFQEHSDPIITVLESITTADGKKLQSFQFFPKNKGNYERVSYGEEGEFYLVFTLSSRSKEGYESAMPAYLKFIAQYREKP
jgi:hypothetical protein